VGSTIKCLSSLSPSPGGHIIPPACSKQHPIKTERSGFDLSPPVRAWVVMSNDSDGQNAPNLVTTLFDAPYEGYPV